MRGLHIQKHVLLETPTKPIISKETNLQALLSDTPVAAETKPAGQSPLNRDSSLLRSLLTEDSSKFLIRQRNYVHVVWRITMYTKRDFIAHGLGKFAGQSPLNRDSSLLRSLLTEDSSKFLIR